MHINACDLPPSKAFCFIIEYTPYLEELPGYYICKNETGPELLLSKSQLFSKYKPDEVCEKGFTISVPKTEVDFVKVMKTFDTTNLSNPFRLGSD